jgi:hypothetical protein
MLTQVAGKQQTQVISACTKPLDYGGDDAFLVPCFANTWRVQPYLVVTNMVASEHGLWCWKSYGPTRTSSLQHSNSIVVSLYPGHMCAFATC